MYSILFIFLWQVAFLAGCGVPQPEQIDFLSETVAQDDSREALEKSTESATAALESGTIREWCGRVDPDGLAEAFPPRAPRRELDYAPVARDLQDMVKRDSTSASGRFIVQSDGPAEKLLGRFPSGVARIRGSFDTVQGFAMEARSWTLCALARDRRVHWISPDRSISGMGDGKKFKTGGHLARTTGARAVWPRGEGQGGLGDRVDGSGIGVAVLDSGVYSAHRDFGAIKDWSDRLAGGSNRILEQLDFTGEDIGSEEDESVNDDLYGHGSHVTGVLIGTGTASEKHDADFGGIARGSEIYSLRVLDSEGAGFSSNVISALDWVLRHADDYDIRVVNMSLGGIPGESFRTDPLCIASRALVDAGITVVASAGNYGQTSSDSIAYGGITTPGIEPSVISVGALDTRDTNDRLDDQVASFSSRGPTMGLDSTSGQYDFLLKPDLLAPGTRRPGPASPGSYLVTNYPDSVVSGVDGSAYLFLNGTSMAAPVVSGTVAMMLEANPGLTPNLIKAILQYTAIPLAGVDVLSQGAGGVNVEGAVRLAYVMTTDISNLQAGDPLVVGGEMPAQVTEINDTSLVWGGTVFWEFRALSGDALFLHMQEAWMRGSSLVWGGNVTLAEFEGAVGQSLVWGGNARWSDPSGQSLVWGGAVLSSTTVARENLLDPEPLLGGLLWSDSMILESDFESLGGALGRMSTEAAAPPPCGDVYPCSM